MTDRPDVPVSPEMREQIDRLRRTLAGVASERPLLTAGLSAQVQRVLAEHAKASKLRMDYRIPEETLRALGSSGFDARLHEAVQRLIVSRPPDPRFREMLQSISRLETLTSAKDYSAPEEDKASYSAGMTSPSDYFAKDEVLVDSMRDLTKGIETLVSKAPGLRLVWRGARDADWAIHSSLFRHLCTVNGVKSPQDRPKRKQPYPDEDQMVRAEKEILRLARTDWRFDGMSALETFARIQHAGGSTRLLDVTKNPYIAAWFAVESNGETDGVDARLIAFATAPVAKSGRPKIADPVVQLDAEWGGREPAWHALVDSTARQGADWGTGARRRLWVPPNYDPRILAQNAAFLLDGVPISTSGVNSYFKDADGQYWSKADLLASASFFAKTAKPTTKPQYNAKNLAPVFTFRILASARQEVREFLETRFGFTKSYIYPDVTALAQHLNGLALAELDES